MSGHGRGRAEPPLQSQANKMMKRIAPSATLCALACCAVPMQTVDASRAACASYGFQPGSDAFAECVMAEQHRHTLRIALRPTAASAMPVPQAPELPAMVMPVQAPALQPLAQAQQPQFCFGSGAFEQCQ
jgi:hypothetical protein